MGHLQLSDHVVQKESKWRTGTCWTKKIQIWWLSLTCPSAAFALQYGDFVPRDCSAAKGPFRNPDWSRIIFQGCDSFFCDNKADTNSKAIPIWLLHMDCQPLSPSYLTKIRFRLRVDSNSSERWERAGLCKPRESALPQRHEVSRCACRRPLSYLQPKLETTHRWNPTW